MFKTSLVKNAVMRTFCRPFGVGDQMGKLHYNHCRSATVNSYKNLQFLQLQLNPHATCPSESTTDTNFQSKRSNHSALQPPPRSPLQSPST